MWVVHLRGHVEDEVGSGQWPQRSCQCPGFKKGPQVLWRDPGGSLKESGRTGGPDSWTRGGTPPLSSPKVWPFHGTGHFKCPTLL